MNTPPGSFRISVIQEGARLHYAVPIALDRQGLLGTVYTEWFSAPGSYQRGLARIARSFLPVHGAKMLARYDPQLPASRVKTSSWLELRHRLRAKRAGSPSEYWHYWLASFSDWATSAGLFDSQGVYGFVRRIDPQLCGRLRDRGIKVVVDQMIAPATIEAQERRLQHDRWPGWELLASDDVELFIEVEQSTWARADSVTCASPYVRDGLLSQGVAASQVEVIPYPIDTAPYVVPDRTRRRDRLTVGFVGQVGLRKGAPYFSEIAKRFKSSGARFVMVGPIALTEKARKDVAQHVELVGPVPRPQVVDWLAKFDVLLFPSTCEGSAQSVVEGMATGLPIVTSPNSGVPFQDGAEGFVVPYDDCDAAEERIGRLLDDPALRLEMGQRARLQAQHLTLAAFGTKLARVFTG